MPPTASPSGPPIPAPRPAFTLIELLVVIAIISLLISITTPSLSRARQQAKATHCLTRLSELMKGTTMYTHDHDFALPPMRYELAQDDNSSGPPIYHGWAELIYQYIYNDDDFSFEHDFPVLHNRDNRFELWTCKEAIPLADSSGHYRVYQYSWSRGNLDHIKHRLPVFTDANPQVTLDEDLRRSDIPLLRIAGLEGEAYIDERHYGGANYAFPDGHATRETQLKEQLALDWDLDPDTPNE